MTLKHKLMFTATAITLIGAPQAFADTFIYDKVTHAKIATISSCVYKFGDNGVTWTVTNTDGSVTSFPGDGGLICDGDNVSEGSVYNPNTGRDKVIAKDHKMQKHLKRKPIGMKVKKTN